ncbi:imidazole glycerol phosphate synthase subunit HisH [Calditerrivibrio nitroreducens]|uniref:Imidazole glycerol phosphate synthase subunit HisH n=1 Tax=Calditerrivibrio nitroreducens (strain DSM 19672 / NBRC 101217 / Yu37-1) TaxID=768670 RepID=E4TH44_CALNY|nr:imidazole glycerol phosphate synthase subunit HisH [Calditerrivibrio nitroreducens]ADR19842.1 imidazole glycerol phosphate synthase subunit hisH [Calditerrivibrio nitroreducens DSM 19672]
MIGIVDYGMGNLRSVYNAFKKLGIDAKIVFDEKEIKGLDRLVLPGVGAFGDCMKGLIDRKLIDSVRSFIDSGKPFLGICVGMQLLFEKSLEFGEQIGLGYFNGTVKRFPEKDRFKIPHMGWNRVNILKRHPLIDGIENGTYLYFVHSYYAPVVEETILSCDYIDNFSAMVVRDNIAAVQFHPEKSQDIGLRILKNFGDWRCC